jgi:signal transduction histidine kinase
MNQAGRARGHEEGYQGGYLIGFVLLTVVGVRVVLLYSSDLLVPALLLAAYGLLYSLEPWLSRRAGWQASLYFALQTLVVITLSNLRPFTDISSLLYIPLCLQVVRASSRAADGRSRRRAFLWLSLYGVSMLVTLVLGMDWTEALALYLTYLAAVTFLVSFDVLYQRMRADQAESRRLVAAWQSANRQLEQYAGQAEELAAARERNRLARELHDSVSQAVFSIRLTAKSARVLLERDPARVPEQVDHLQAMTGEALAELRALIAQLRPPPST